MGGAASHAHHDTQNPQQQEPSDADKRSQEDIMFGNQQNKPAGMVDDLIVFPERKASSSSSAHAAKEASGAKLDNNATHHQQTQEKAAGRMGSGADAAAPLSEDEVPEPSVAATADGEQPEQQAAGELLGTAAGAQAGKFDYYDYADDTGVSTAGAAGSDNDERAPGQPDNGGELDYSLYDYGDVGGMASGVFRRKRNLRNSLEELLRNRRLHRRALRLKRDANMDDLLFFLTQMAKQEPYPLFAEQEVPPVSRITLNPPEPESPLEQYLNELGAMNNEERARALVALAALADQEQLVPVPRTGRPTFEDEQPEALPDWFQVARRSHGTFYPQDYRYLVMPPTPQKRNVGADHWGRVLRQRRRQQRAQDQTDVNRLYALAGLMAQPDQEDLWREP
ncbi:hypothetical protein V5799_032256 [Amblyomma americanum]|uniref:Uncharacterized protein n=1 Tax=Amblyomma americanum TaxID=6943 RepID=A0AAQ4DRN5_AMBAM